MKMDCTGIKLSGGKVAIIDIADYPELVKYTWFISDKGYATRHSDTGTVFMHRQILNTQKGFILIISMAISSITVGLTCASPVMLIIAEIGN